MRTADTSSRLSIGEVLRELQGEFPELTVSKIRFLESEGLISPERTPSGYRKFSPADVQRLRFILKLQKERYLPLKVIREKLKELESGKIRAGDLAGEMEGHSELREDLAAYDQAIVPLEKLEEVVDVPLHFARTLEEYGLICSHEGEEGPYYEREDIKIIRVAQEFSRYGLEPRHLRMYESFTDRELAAFEQVVLPALKSKDQEMRKKALENLARMIDLSRELKDLILKNRAKEYFRRYNTPVPY